MSAFDPITVSWGGVDYTVPADKVMGLIGRIEGVITIAEIHTMASRGGAFQLTRIAKAYATVLRYAGASEVKDEDVYLGMFEQGTAGQELIMQSVSGLLSMMVPPSKLIAAINKDSVVSGKAKPRVSRASPSSKRRSKPQSAGA